MNILFKRRTHIPRNVLLGSILCIIIPIIFLWSLVSHFNKPLGFTHNDVYQTMFIVKHVMDTVRWGTWDSLSELPMLYGFSNSYFYNEPYVIHAIAGLPVYLLSNNIIITLNVLSILTVILSLLAVYAYAYHLTKAVFPSVIAAIIAVLNPFIMTRFPDHLNLVTLVFLPLIFLFIDRMFTRPTSRDVFIFFLLLIAQILTSFYYSAFLTLILPIYAFIRFRQYKTNFKKLLNRGMFAGILLFLLVVFGLVKIYGNTFLFTESSSELDRLQRLYFSAWPTDWLFTSESNILYGAVRPWIANLYPTLVHHGTPAEQSLFPGFTVLLLWLFAFWVLRKNTYRKHYLLLAGLAGGSFVLSLGPVLHITSSITVPWLFDIVSQLNPAFRMTRVSARLAAFVFLFGGIIAAMAVDTLLKVIKRGRMILAIGILILILIEYWNRPFEFLTVSPQRLVFYSRLEQRKDINVILDIPVGDAMLSSGGPVRQEYLDTHYLLWAMIGHSKKLIGGYQGSMPLEYYIRMRDISINFPSPEIISEIRSWGTDAIILHADEYTHPTDYHLAKVKLTAMGIPLIAEEDGLALFDLTTWKGE
jgi:hypothetical protein